MAVEVIERLEDLAALRFAQHIQQMTHKRRILQIKTKIKNITHKQSYFEFSMLQIALFAIVVTPQR